MKDGSGGGALGVGTIPLGADDGRPPTTPLPDWMLEGLESPTAGEPDGVTAEPRPSQPRSSQGKSGMGRLLVWAVVITLAAAGGWLAAMQFGAG